MHEQRDVWQMKGDWKIRPYYPFIKEEWIEGLSKILRDRSISNFSVREDFEKKLAKYCNCKYAIAVNSGSSAIIVGMMSLGLKKENVVLGPNYGNIAWSNCCRFLNIIPYAIDVRRDNFCLDELILSKRLNASPDLFDAVLYINHAGYTGSQLDSVVSICREHNVFLLEDSCNALGQWFNGIHAGTRGDIGFISFGVPKLITCGEGGAILLNNKDLYKKCKELVYHGGWYDPPVHSRLGVGSNFVMPMHNAYFLSKQLDDIDELLGMRDNVCNYYELKGIKLKRFHQSPSIYEYETTKPKTVVDFGRKFGIQLLYHNYVTHSHHFIDRPEDTPNAKYIQDHTVLLPSTLNLSKGSIDLVCAAIKMGERQ